MANAELTNTTLLDEPSSTVDVTEDGTGEINDRTIEITEAA